MNFIKNRYKELFIWTAYFLVLVSVTYNNWITDLHGLDLTAFIVLVHAMIFYGNYYYLMPRTFAKQQYALFFWGAVLFGVSCFIFTYTVFRIAFSSGYWIPPENSNFLAGFQSPDNVFQKDFLWARRIVFGGMNVFFISVLYFNAEQDKKKKQELLELINEKVTAEIKLLRLQINPHFLFNALNNIYSKAILEESEVADSIHKLSALLRYVLYDSDTDSIDIIKELEYINNYIDLQKGKTDNIDAVDLTVSGNITSATIMPMLLISFVENAFKHGNVAAGGWIKIHIGATKEVVEFSCINSIALGDKVKDNASGIGLKNVQKRLELNYANKHQLTINKEVNQFSVNLKIANDPKMLDN
jgi:two-component system LytT family sensor kinase